MEYENPNEISLVEKYRPQADADGYLSLSAFVTQELRRQTKSIAAFLDGEEGTNEEINFGKGLRFKGESGNYSDMKIHIDDLETFIQRVRKYYD
ncbi:MAG: hypothetical protein NTX55_00510 [Candidatus Parcubacteria bacterium]|nr:hypothetical protein [Candidatus Parcubacteria bacterium]